MRSLSPSQKRLPLPVHCSMLELGACIPHALQVSSLHELWCGA